MEGSLMATVTEMREWLRGQGHDVPQRGRLRPELLDLYNDAHPTPILEDDPDWDLADAGSDMIDPDELEPSIPMQPERPPRTARSQRAARKAEPVTQKASTFLGRLLGSDTKKDAAKKGKTVKRTSLEKLITDVYGEFGKMLGQLSMPMSRCVQSQAPFAGLVWEDMLRDTIIDKALQPVARAEEKWDKGFALVATPLAVFAVEQNHMALANDVITPGQFAVRQMAAMPVLRRGLRKQLEISRLYADQIQAKIQQDAELDAEVDALIAMFFAAPQGTMEPEPEPEMAGAAA